MWWWVGLLRISVQEALLRCMRKLVRKESWKGGGVRYSSVVAKAAGSENRSDEVAARRLSIGRLNSPLLGMPVRIKKQWISLTETSSGLVGLPKSVLNCSTLVDSVWRNRLRVESPS